MQIGTIVPRLSRDLLQRPRFSGFFLGLLVMFLGVNAAHVQPASKRVVQLSIEGKPATRAVIWQGDQPLEWTDIGESPMLRGLAGIAGTLDARALASLRRSMKAPVKVSDSIPVIGTIRLTRGAATDNLQIAREADGVLVILSKGTPGMGNLLDWDLLSDIGVSRAVLDGVVTDEPQSRDQRDLVQYQSHVVLNPKTQRVRFKRQYSLLSRTLGQERFRIRLPRGSDSELPPGVLVWISPSPNGQIPQIFFEACDELNLIAVGVDQNGNTRKLTDRFQNHFDSLATIKAHYRIDDRRVYVTGMSGGGRCSSILQLAYPDVFMGAVPIVGLDSYHKTPTGAPGKYWPDRQGRPDTRLFGMLKNRRIAAITGTMDFNAPEMRKRTQQMKNDKVNIKLDVIEGMGHTMPSWEQFLESIRWVDELQQERIGKAAAKARVKLDQLIKRSGRECGDDVRARKILIQITVDAPWSEAAWEAAEILGIEQ